MRPWVWITSTHVKSWAWQYASTILALGNQIQKNFWSLLASRLSERCCLKNELESSWGRSCMLISGFYMHTHLNTQMHIHNKLKKVVKKNRALIWVVRKHHFKNAFFKVINIVIIYYVFIYLSRLGLALCAELRLVCNLSKGWDYRCVPACPV